MSELGLVFARMFSAVLFTSLVAAARGAVDYLRDVKPIFTQHCVRCHGDDKEEAGLRMHTAEHVRIGGDSGSLVKLRADGKSLLLQVVEGTHEDIPSMPYKKPALTTAQIEILREWVKQGAPSPEQEAPGKFLHWSFIAPAPVVPPAVRFAAWPRNPIDRFILAQLETRGIAPAPEADRVTLLRRVSLDLTGLPPTPADTAAFLEDRQPDAYERVVARLLASPHYGERWARRWLDVARYADSSGYATDGPREIWKYRDWVVNAFNRDLPFDQFAIEQLAGDLLPDATVDQKVATGFNRNTQINLEGGIDSEQFRIESVLDRVNTYGTAFLGLTIACAQCHDHKFDPIKQREYYQLYAFFNNTVNDGHGKKVPGGRLEFPLETVIPTTFVRDLEEARADLDRLFDAKMGLISAWIAMHAEDAGVRLNRPIRAALKTPWDKMTIAQKRLVYRQFDAKDEDFIALEKQLTQLEAREPRPVTTLVMSELAEPRESAVFIKGDYTRRGERVLPGTPAVLPPLRAGRANRLDLAQWTVDPANPLTARVAVNRIWQEYFGRGLVETENDFGTQGEMPTHPELLDWLATQFVAGRWSMKAIHQLIVTSAAYRQSSHARPDLELEDPLNRLLARQSRLRLDAEIVRDVALAASGLLSSNLGGPPVYPPQPDGAMALGITKRQWGPSKGSDRYRRGLYTHLWRATPHPAFAVFDAPDALSTCTRRLRSNTPLQALVLLNDEQFFEFAVALGQRVQQEARGGLPEQIDYAFRLCLARAPAESERDRVVALFQRQFANTAGDETVRRDKAWTLVARVLLNLDETITRE